MIPELRGLAMLRAAEFERARWAPASASCVAFLDCMAAMGSDYDAILREFGAYRTKQEGRDIFRRLSTRGHNGRKPGTVASALRHAHMHTYPSIRGSFYSVSGQYFQVFSVVTLCTAAQLGGGTPVQDIVAIWLCARPRHTGASTSVRSFSPYHTRA